MRELFRFPVSNPSTELSAADANTVTDKILHEVYATLDTLNSDEAVEIIAKIPEVNQLERLMAYRDIYDSYSDSLPQEEAEELGGILKNEAYSFISKRLDLTTVQQLGIPSSNFDDANSVEEITYSDIVAVARVQETIQQDSIVADALPQLIDAFARLPSKTTDAKLLKDMHELSLSNGKSILENLSTYNAIQEDGSEKAKSDKREQSVDRDTLKIAAERDKKRHEASTHIGHQAIDSTQSK